MAAFVDFEDIYKKSSDENRKKMRRDIEKKRRQEMATLYASLRTLIPVDYLKGKRSMSDQINEAVRYIKDQEIKVSKLRDRREELKKLNNGGVVDSECGTSNNGQCCCVSIRPYPQGFEVSFVSELPPTRAVQVLLDEGFSVVRCNFTKANERYLHIIHFQVHKLMNFDLSELQWKLANAI